MVPTYYYGILLQNGGGGPIYIQTGNQPAVIPIVANYFYNTPHTSQDGAETAQQHVPENGARFNYPSFNPTLSRQFLYYLS